MLHPSYKELSDFNTTFLLVMKILEIEPTMYRIVGMKKLQILLHILEVNEYNILVMNNNNIKIKVKLYNTP